jgi:hypothetical protein
MVHEELPGRTFVAVDADGSIVGTAESEPNHGARPHTWRRPASWSTLSGKAAASGARSVPTCWKLPVQTASAPCSFNAVVETNTAAVNLWRSLGFEILATVPEAFRHPTAGYVGLYIMYRRL